MTSRCCQGIDRMFGDRTAARDLRRYRRKGPSRPTRRLLAEIRARGLDGATVLDIGGGIGAIQHDLLDAGARHAVGVEASAAYARAARAEADRRGRGERMTVHHGDFVSLAPTVQPADVVTLDRVICCYPDMPALVGRSADRARRVYGLVHPRDAWWTRLGIALVNLGMRATRRSFRSYVHGVGDVDATAGAHGLALSVRAGVGPVWQVAVYERRGSGARRGGSEPQR